MLALLCLGSLQLTLLRAPTLQLIHTIRGNISPKSIVTNGQGYFIAQNMMYRHSLTVYDRTYSLVATVSDAVTIDGVQLKGSPVEAAASPDGRTLWVSNYQMYGKGFSNPGSDRTQSRPGVFNHSYLYQVSTNDWRITATIPVGSVPKYVAATRDGKTVLVSNWVSSDVSIVDTRSLKERRRIPLGRFPRGIAISPDDRTAYVALVGSTRIALIQMDTNRIEWMDSGGVSPRHLVLSPDGETLYASLNNSARVSRISVMKRRVTGQAAVGRQPRSMALSPDGRWLYVVNYSDDTLSQIRTLDMKVTKTLGTPDLPIGVCIDPQSGQIWVACYSGVIQIYGPTIP